MSLVSLARVRENTPRALKKAIAGSLDLIGYRFGAEDRIVIKPNLCYYWDYSTGQTTDPRFVSALIDLIREKSSDNVDISLVESDASAMKCRHVFRMLGYEKLSEDTGVRLVNLSEDRSDMVEVTVEGKPFRVKVPQTIRNADLKINVPKIKYTMAKIEMTCALKNIFGCNPYPRKFRYHSRLEEMIVASNKAMRFDLCLVDGNIVSGTQPRRLGLVMAGQDHVAIDVAASKIAGLNPRTIRYIQLAHKEGLGNTSIIPRGLPMNYFRDRYPRKTAKKILLGKAYSYVTRLGLGGRLGLE
jgi:uncharacterized protein (DUF362 family)